jgi:phosphoribosylformimino-5-aminoimidazole carboxamide ribonucleotide (ProFAR) isomerase
MILLPAVDIRDGKAVRLRQGRFDEETVYSDDPLEAARSFVGAGARFLHIVDLDGAREGEPANLEHVERITSELEVPVELGGGLRSIASIRRRCRRGPAAWCLARPPSPTRICSTRRSRPSRRASSLAWT